jgi:hypothetical protein
MQFRNATPYENVPEKFRPEFPFKTGDRIINRKPLSPKALEKLAKGLTDLDICLFNFLFCSGFGVVRNAWDALAKLLPHFACSGECKLNVLRTRNYKYLAKL